MDDLDLLLYQYEQISDPAVENGISYLPYFTSSSKKRHLIDTHYYERNFIVGFFNHLIQLHQFTVDELSAVTKYYCKYSDEHNTVKGFDHLSNIHLNCTVQVLRNLSGFELIQDLYHASYRIITVEPVHDEDIQWSGIYFINQDLTQATQIDFVVPSEPYLRHYTMKRASQNRVILSTNGTPNIEMYILFPDID